MAKKPTSGTKTAERAAPARPSALLDTRVVYDGDCFEQSQISAGAALILSRSGRTNWLPCAKPSMMSMFRRCEALYGLTR